MMAEADINRVSGAPQWTREELLEIAARALGRIDTFGRPGLRLITNSDIEAMAGALVLLGLKPIQPGSATPATFTKENRDDRV